MPGGTATAPGCRSRIRRELAGPAGGNGAAEAAGGNRAAEAGRPAEADARLPGAASCQDQRARSSVLILPGSFDADVTASRVRLTMREYNTPTAITRAA